MKSKTYKKATDLAVALGLPPSRGILAEMKADLVKEITKTIHRKNDCQEVCGPAPQGHGGRGQHRGV